MPHSEASGASASGERSMTLTSEAQSMSIDTAAPAQFAPLTGRDHEVSLLKDRWEQAQEGMGQIVLLIGEPGLGKSRLVESIKQHVAEQAREMPLTPGSEGAHESGIVEWRCSQHFRNTELY